MSEFIFKNLELIMASYITLSVIMVFAWFNVLLIIGEKMTQFFKVPKILIVSLFTMVYFASLYHAEKYMRKNYFEAYTLESRKFEDKL